MEDSAIQKKHKKDRDNFRKSRRKDCLEFTNFDEAHKVDTAVDLVLSNDGLKEYIPGILNNSRAFRVSSGYQPSPLPHIDTINKYLTNNIKGVQDYTFIDLGAGKNKVLLHNFLTGQKYKKMIGVEIDPELYSIGKANCKVICEDIEMVNLDILDYECKNAPTIYFTFSPCYANHWSKFLDKNKDVLLKNKTVFVSIVGFFTNGKKTSVITNLEKEFGFSEIYDKDMIHIYISENVELLK